MTDCVDVLLPDGADPFPARDTNGFFYLTYTTGGDVTLIRARSVRGLAKGERKVVWTPPKTGPWSSHLWAPEIHSIRGKWYVYVAAANPDRSEHRMYALRCKSSDPFGEWEFMGKVADEKTDKWAIDGTILELDRKLYFVWSGWEGDKGGAQNLYIAPMSNPWTISGPRVLISEPKLPWETKGVVNEGPEALKDKGRVHIIYSASGSWTDDYCLGRLTLRRNADPLKPGAWEKYPEAVFASGNGVTAPGHAGFVTEGKTNYIVYHAAKRPGAGWDRFIRAQTFTFDRDGFPQFGEPCSEKTMNDCIDVLRESGADPFPIRGADGYIYLAYSGRGGIKSVRGRTLAELATAESTLLWAPPATGMWSKELWAPELHFVRGSWYIYVAADDGHNDNHRMYALRCTGSDPHTGKWEMAGKVADSKADKWAIDGTILELNKNLYFIWSGWEGDKNGQQNLYIAPMSDPITISGPRVLISEPKLPWELHGKPLINEGPEVLTYKEETHIIYSASGSWTDDYCLGRLTLKHGADPLMPDAWQKYPDAVFASGNGVVAPGHAGFVEDGGANYIVYHAAKHPGAGWNRFVRAQKFTFDKNGAPDFGKPCPRNGKPE